MAIADKLTQIANNVPLVYEAGYEKGKAEGGDTTEAYNQGVEAGKIAQNVEFWNNFIGNNRSNFGYAFYGWNEEAFVPPKNKTLSFKGEMQRAFYNFNAAKTGGSVSTDMIALLNERGAVLDFKNITSCSYMFANAKISALPTLNLTSCKSLEGLCNNSSITKIEKIILKDNGTNTFTNTTFNGKLQHVTFEGTIGTSISFQNCSLLSADSVADIIAHLGIVTTAQTITFHADVKDKLTDEQKATITTTKGWTLA